MTSLNGKVALVTGAGQGLGAEICKVLAGEGAIVALADIKPDGLRKTAGEINGNGCKAQGYVLDVSDLESVERVVGEVVGNCGRLDYVINNAGIDYTKPVEEMSYEEWDRVVRVNLHGPFMVSKAAFPHLKRQRGHIVNIVSTAAKRAWENASAYHASKWGLLGFSHALHTEARKQRVKVTALIAGGMKTPFILERFPDVDPSVLQDPKNVADTVRYVLSQPAETVIPEVMVIPMTETSWP